MKAKDIMRREPITVTPEMTLKELAQFFINEKISGAPVVGRHDKLLGVVSQTDLVRRDGESKESSAIPGFYGQEGKEEYAKGFSIEDPDYTRVSDVMTPAVLSATEETPVEELAGMMWQKRIHRIIITREGRLCGIVTSMDMLKALLALTGKTRASVKT